MESKMRFGREVRSEKPQASDRGVVPETLKKNTAPNRRSFLQGMAGLLAGTVLESESFAKKSKKSKEKERTPEEWDALFDSPWQELMREIEDFDKIFYQATDEILEPLLKKYSSNDRAKEIVTAREQRQKIDYIPGMPEGLSTLDLPDILSPEDQLLVRKQFQSTYRDRTKSFLEKIKQTLQKISETHDIWQWIDLEEERVEPRSYQRLQHHGSREQKLWKKITTPKRGDIYVLPEAHKIKSTISPSKTSLNSSIRRFQEYLKRFGSEGLVYSFLSELSHDIHSTMRDEKGRLRTKKGVYEGDFDEYDNFFSIYASDYLPSSDEILPEHIDPFIAFVQKKYSEADQNISRSKWAASTYQSKFKKILDEPAVRQQLQAQPNLSLAGAFSLIKAVIEYKENISPDSSESNILDKLLVERAKLAKQKLIDAQTTVVRFYGFDDKDTKGKNRFTSAPMDEILAAVGVPKEKNLLFETEQDPNAFENFLSTVGKSRGKTFVFTLAHGSEKAWSTRDAMSYSIGHIGFQLTNRIVGALREGGIEAAQRTLSDVVIFSHACHPYVFLYENLLPSLKKYVQLAQKNHKVLLERSSKPGFKEKVKELYGVEQLTAQELKNLGQLLTIDVEFFDLPRVIGNGQKGNVVYSNIVSGVDSSFVLNALLQRKQGIIDRHAVIGEDFFSAESYAYPRGGDTTFSGSEKGRLFPISEVHHPHKPIAPEKERDLA